MEFEGETEGENLGRAAQVDMVAALRQLVCCTS